MTDKDENQKDGEDNKMIFFLYAYILSSNDKCNHRFEKNMSPQKFTNDCNQNEKI